MRNACNEKRCCASHLGGGFWSLRGVTAAGGVGGKQPQQQQRAQPDTMSKRGRSTTALHALFSALPAQSSPLGLDVAPGEAVSLSLPSTLLHAAAGDVGEGTLWVTSQRVAWTPAGGGGGGGGGGGLSLEYPRITLHAVCRDPAAFPRPCLYCQVTALGGCAVEEEGGGGGGGGGGDEGEGGAAPAAGSGDVFFAPADPAALDALFTAMTAAAELHPDAAGGDEDGEGEGMGAGFDWVTALMAQQGGGAGGEEEGAAAAAAVEGQFKDAE